MDRATPNLPSRDFKATSRFYQQLGFSESWRDRGWMILKRGTVALEFFPYAELDPLGNYSSSCLRLDDMASFYDQALAAGIPEAQLRFPRLTPPAREASGLTIAYLVDPDGSLIRLIQNP